MRGKILAFDYRSGEGHITGDDGRRYRFVTEEWMPEAAPSPGEPVDFEADGNQAVAIYSIGRVFVPGPKSRIGAALLALFLGPFGIHKFYLNRNGAGLITLVISLAGVAFAGIPTAFMGMIGVIECILYLVRSDEEFERIYVQGNRAWF